MIGAAKSGGSRVEILVAACEGSMRLACATGLPIVHVDAVADPRAALARLDAVAHGSGVRVDTRVRPIATMSGWDNWKPFPLFGLGTAADAPGVSVARGRMSVVLPRGVPISEFREQLHASLRHLRLQDVGGDVAYLRQRSLAAAHRAIHPRYTPATCTEGARLVTDLYCVDPTWQTWRLFWHVAAARLAAQEGRRPRWI